MQMKHELNFVSVADGVTVAKGLADASTHFIISDIPYGIGTDEWDVLQSNTNSSFLGVSPAQVKAGAVFKCRGKPLNAGQRLIVRYPWCTSVGVSHLPVNDLAF